MCVLNALQMSILLARSQNSAHNLFKSIARLTWELPRVSCSDFHASQPVTTAHCRDRNPERTWVPTASFMSYGLFTEFLAHSHVLAGKPKHWDFDLKFRPYIGSMTLNIFWKFQPHSMFRSRVIELSSELSFFDVLKTSGYCSKIRYLENGTCCAAETFRICWGSLSLYMGKTSDRNPTLFFAANAWEWARSSVKRPSLLREAVRTQILSGFLSRHWVVVTS